MINFTCTPCIHGVGVAVEGRVRSRIVKIVCLFFVLFALQGCDQDEVEDGAKMVLEDVKEKADKEGKERRRRQKQTLALHLKKLKSKDKKERENAAEMLGLLNYSEAVPELITALKDSDLFVILKAHGALNKITGKNFGYKNQKKWLEWWNGVKKEFIKSHKQAKPANVETNRNSSSLGLWSLNNGKWAAAEKYFRKAVKKSPHIPDYWNNLGLSLLEQARYKDAVSSFKKAIVLNSNLPQPYLNIGSCLVRMKKPKAALPWYRKSAKKDMDGRLWEPLWTVGNGYLKNESFELAKEFLETASEKAAICKISDPRIFRDLAQTYYALKEYHLMQAAVQKVQSQGYSFSPEFVKKVTKVLADRKAEANAKNGKSK